MTRQKSSAVLIVLSVGSLLAAPGCGGGPVKVRGVVTLDGKPLSGATVTFDPVGQGHAAGGLTDEDGSFQLTTYRPEDGALPGEYRVTVKLDPVNYHGPGPSEAGTGQKMYEILGRMAMSPEGRAKARAEQKKLPRSTVPAIYGNPLKTPLRAVVPPPGEVQLELQSTPR